MSYIFLTGYKFEKGRKTGIFAVAPHFSRYNCCFNTKLQLFSDIGGYQDSRNHRLSGLALGITALILINLSV